MRSISNWFLKPAEKLKKKTICDFFKEYFVLNYFEIERLITHEMNDHYIARNMKGTSWKTWLLSVSQTSIIPSYNRLMVQKLSRGAVWILITQKFHQTHQAIPHSPMPPSTTKRIRFSWSCQTKQHKIETQVRNSFKLVNISCPC